MPNALTPKKLRTITCQNITHKFIAEEKEERSYFNASTHKKIFFPTKLPKKNWKISNTRI